MRRKLGVVLVAGGTLLLSFVGGTYAHGIATRERIRAEWEARQDVESAWLVADAATSAPTVRGAPVGRLAIPAIGLDEIIVEGVDDFELNAGPGHLPGSPLPGEHGNAILSAHRDRHFSRIDEVSVGDTIVTWSRHNATTWMVVSKRVVSREAPALFSTPEPRLTLTTCWPVRFFGPAPDRLILTAMPVAAAAHVREPGGSAVRARNPLSVVGRLL